MLPNGPGEDSAKSDRRRKLLSITILALVTILLLFGVWVIVRPFTQILVAAVILTVSFYPMYEAIHRKITSPSAAALACVLLLLVLILVPLTLLITTVAGEVRQVYSELQQQSAIQGGWPEYLEYLVERPTEWLSSRIGMEAPKLKATITQKAQVLAGSLLRWSGSLFGNLTVTLGEILLTLFVMFFLFQWGDRVGDRLPTYVPVEPHRLEVMLQTMKTAIVANLYGMVAVAAVQGVLVGIGFVIAGLTSPVLWGLVAAFASLIPIVGTALVWVPAVLALIFAGSYGKAVFLAIYGVVVVGMSDNIVRPLVLRRGLEMNTLAIFVSLMGGVAAFGFVGLFAGPVIFTMAYVMLKMLHEERVAWSGRETRENGVKEPQES